MITALLSALAFAPLMQGGQTVTLARVNKENEKLAYDVKSHIQVEGRMTGLQTWMPEDFDLNYGFTTLVTKVKPDGVVDIHYQRPTMTEVTGETADSPPKEKVDKIGIDFSLTVSPANEIIAMKDLAPKKKNKEEDSGRESLFGIRRVATGQDQEDSMGGFLQNFLGDIYRLALNVGGFDSALDFAPKLPLDDVKPGDTWKRTVGYSPQKLKGKAGKTAIQRLDYTYAYQGIVDSGDRKVYRVVADLDLNTDLAEFLHQATGTTSADTGLKSIKTTLKTHIDFDLDMQTKQTLKAVSTSEGGFAIIATRHPDEPVHEERFKGRTVMRLVGRA